jgi:hypothetical protein
VDIPDDVLMSRCLPVCWFLLTSACTDEVDVTSPAAVADAGAVEGSLEGSPGDEAFGIGLPCTSDTECATGTCILSYPGGYCSIKGCSPATGAGCPSDALCRGGGGVMTTLCFERCPASGSCREGYGHVVDGGQRVCCGVRGEDPGFCAPTPTPACN